MASLNIQNGNKMDAEDLNMSTNHTLTFQEVAMQYWTFKTAIIIYQVYPILFFCLGLIGNGISLAVFLQREMRKYPSFMYLATLAVFNQFALTMGVAQIFGGITNGDNPALCKTIAFFFSFSTHVSVFCIVLSTIESLIVVTKPMKAAVLCTRKRALRAIFIIIIVFIGINMHLFWTMEISRLTGNCIPRTDGNWWLFVRIWSWVDTSLYAFIPVIFLFVANIIIGALMHSANKRVRRLTNEHYRGAYNKQVTIMQLTVSTFFLICAMPTSVLMVYQPFWKSRVKDNAEEYALNTFINSIFAILFGANHTFNIFLYFLSGKRFRNELKKLFTCAKCCRRRRSSLSALTKTADRNSKQSRQEIKRSSVTTLRTISSTSESNVDTCDRKVSNGNLFGNDNSACTNEE